MNSSHSRSIWVFFHPTHKPSHPPWDSIYSTFCGSIPPISCVTADSWWVFHTLKVNLCYYFWALAQMTVLISLLRDATTWQRFLLFEINFKESCQTLHSASFTDSGEQWMAVEISFTFYNYKRLQWSCCVFMLIRSSWWLRITQK